MNKTCRLFALAAVFATALSPLFAGLVYSLETTQNGTSQPMTMKFQGDQLKMEMPAVAGQQVSVVFDASKGEMMTIDHARKQFFRFDSETVAQIAEQVQAARAQMEAAMENVPAGQRAMVERMMKQRMPAMPEEPEPIRIEKTGEEKKIAGYQAALVKIFAGAQNLGEAWVVPAEKISGGEDLMGLMGKFSGFMQKLMSAVPGAQQQGGGSEWLRVWGELGGMPVATTQLENGQVKSESVLKGVEERDLPASEFAPPADYREQKIEMPSLQ